MPEHVYRITEIVGSSTDSVDDAIRNGARRGAKRCITLTGSKSPTSVATSPTRRSATFQVTMKVGFRLDDNVE